MYILAIETTGKLGSVAVLNIETGEVLGTEVSLDEMSHLKDLIPMTERLLKRLNIEKKEIEYVASSVGPGSFTGIRIGVATARALAQSLNTRCISVPTLSAFMYKPSAEEIRRRNDITCAIINARRGQVYGMVSAYMPDGPYMLTDVLEVITEDVLPEGANVVFFGDGVDAYRDKIAETLKPFGEERFCFADESDRYQDASSVAKCALSMLKNGYTCTYEELLPDYMRAAEAETKLKNGELAISKMRQE